LRSIAGLAAPTAGRVWIGGRDVTALVPQQRGVGLVFQQYALFPNLSVADNIAFGPQAQGWTAQRTAQRVAELLSLIDLQGHAAQRPAQLSGGQRQRVAMARALAPQPALLLLDEPFSAIDESFRLPLRRAFRDLQRQLQQSCVLVTHDREEAFELADQVAVMLEGRLAQCDTPEALLQRPASRAVARFLGSFNLYEPGPGLPAQGGHLPAAGYVAPLSSLREAGDADAALAPGGWVFDAVVTGRYPGLVQTQLQLLSEHGHALTMVERSGPHSPGERLRCCQPIESLQGHPT
jgi:ABC-type sulfate/molybdate transport systems ATPase subunit